MSEENKWNIGDIKKFLKEVGADVSIVEDRKECKSLKERLEVSLLKAELDIEGMKSLLNDLPKLSPATIEYLSKWTHYGE